jgi:hypothetical protein
MIQQIAVIVVEIARASKAERVINHAQPRLVIGLVQQYDTGAQFL